MNSQLYLFNGCNLEYLKTIAFPIKKDSCWMMWRSRILRTPHMNGHMGYIRVVAAQTAAGLACRT